MDSRVTVHWKVLTGVRAVVGDTQVPLGGPRQREVAAFLVLSSAGPVSVERLIEALWGDDAPPTARNSVQRFVADLRRALGAAAGRIVTVPEGYQLIFLDGDSSDRDRFAQQIDEARDLLALHEPLRALKAIDAGMPVSPNPLAGLRGACFVDDERRVLEGLLTAGATLRVECLLAASEPGRAVPAAERLVGSDPFRERGWALLMAALFGAGRQQEALDAYARLWRLLADELGQEPSVPLRLLHLRILQQDSSLALETPLVSDDELLSATSGLPRPRSLEPTFIPHFRAALVGREPDVLLLRATLAEHRLVSVVGPAGIGKTRLAARVATIEHDEGRRVWFVKLAGILPGGEVAAIAAALESTAISEPDLVALLTARSGLLVLDNCEHLLESLAPVVDRLSLECERVTFLTTSREPLHVEGERVIRPAALDPDGAATELFRIRAEEAGAHLGAADEQRIAAVCRQVDGLPFAIEIAASRAASLGLRALQQSLDTRLTGLRQGDHETEPGHRTLDAAIDWSYRLLSRQEQHALRSLAVFEAGFELDAVTFVLQVLGVAGDDVPRLLAGLADQSLVAYHDIDGIDRYRLLETVRAFALDQLRDSGDAKATQDAHAQWVAEIADTGDRDIASLATHNNSVRLEREVENWRAALSFVTRQRASDLAARLAGPATIMLVVSRADLGPMLVDLAAAMPQDHPIQGALAAAHFARAYTSSDPRAMEAFLAIRRRIDPDDRDGLSRHFEAAYLITLSNQVEQAAELRASLVADPQVPADLRDFDLANALYGVHVANRPDLERGDWAERAMRIATHSEVPTNRLLARLAIAMALWRTAPERAVDWARLALAETGPIPMSHRRIWHSSISRFLLRHDPASAAGPLQVMLAEQVRHGYAVDWTLLVTSAALLAKVGHPVAADAVATIAATPAAANLARTVSDVEDRARYGSVIGLETLVRRMAAALAEVAAGPRRLLGG